MAPHGAAIIGSSRALLVDGGDAIDRTFLAALRRRTPRLAAAAPPGLATTIVEAIAADAEGGHAMPLVLSALLHDNRVEPRASTAVGLAFLAALAHELGPRFEESVRAAWSEAYVSLVQRLMAARWNRMDLVA